MVYTNLPCFVSPFLVTLSFLWNRMSGRQRSGTYSSLCESETDFVPIVRSNSTSCLTSLDEVDLENALLKSSSSIETPSTMTPSQAVMYRWYFYLIFREGNLNPLYSTFQTNMSVEILSRLEVVTHLLSYLIVGSNGWFGRRATTHHGRDSDEL